MLNAWSAPTNWIEVCQRASGRRRYHSVRRFRVRLRRRQVARCLVCEGLEYGVRARLARQFRVSKATISADVRTILAMPAEHMSRRRYQNVRQRSDARQGHRHLRTREEMMGKLSFRIEQRLLDRLQVEADARKTTPSHLGRQAIQAFLKPKESTHGQFQLVAEPRATMPPDRDVCAKILLAGCPVEVQTMLHQTVDRTRLPLFEVIRALLIAMANRRS